MRTIFTLVPLLLLCVSTPGHAQSCPPGTFAWIDNAGNATCRDPATKADIITRPNPSTGCPNGSFKGIDSLGNAMCQTPGGTTYYDTTKECPIGTVPWIGNWGRSICKSP